MKEHQIEEKAKRYDELLLKLQKAKVDGNVCDEMYYRVIDDIVPELKENEDENIRKTLIDFFKRGAENGAQTNGVCDKDIIAWLEKQGEQVSAIRWYDASFIPQEYKELLVEWNSSDTTWHDVAFYHADTKTFKSYESELKNVTRWCYVEDLYWEQSNVKGTGISQHDEPQGKSAFEAINEEKVDNANKVELKFKVGDWITNGVYTCKIVEVIDNSYKYTFPEGASYLGVIDDMDKEYRLWTIDDAKDGDVLSWDDSKCITIFKNIYDKDSFNSYGFVGSCTGTFESRIAYHDIKGAHPATKEQRDLLFTKMEEAGYEWDAEKKKLKKIEQKPVEWSEVDKVRCEEAIQMIESNGTWGGKLVSDWLKSIKDRVLPQPKQEWSEEDNQIALSIEQVMNCASLLNIVPEKIDKIKTWLKSLKQRYTWKPSDEQMEAFEHFVRGIWESCYDSPYENNAKLLYSLLEQLKKLK